MPAPLIVVAGTGTGVGKSHVATALLLAWGRTARVVGYKPVETGVIGEADDARRLERASSFHVKPPPWGYVFAPAVSPHLASRAAKRPIILRKLWAESTRLRRHADGVVLELAGGLFTPLSPRAANADLVLRLAPTATILVAPDRLGVLHDLSATLRAARALGLVVTGIVLSAPARADASTGTNRQEVRNVTRIPVLASLARAPAGRLAAAPAIAAVLAGCLPVA